MKRLLMLPASILIAGQGPGEGDHRVLRGGAFITDPWYSRIAQRNFMEPDFRANYLGFRVVKLQPSP